jgi:uncharacterized protein YbjQ (UPF0145 family)
MSEEVVEKSFKKATEEVEAAHRDAVAELKDKVQKAKAEALKKISS